MKSKLPWLILFLVGIALAIFFVLSPIQQAGDIVEYFGTSQSILNHFGVNLTITDQKQLEQILHPAYFSDPGYYIGGRADQRYPVHFVFYSVLLIPSRLLLRAFGANELNAFALTNLLIVLFTIAIILKNFLKEASKKFALIFLVFLSPLAFFLAWPGPDIYYVMLILLSLYSFSSKKYFIASLLAALASWHSQPLMIASFAFVAFYLKNEVHLIEGDGKKHLSFSLQSFFFSSIVAIVLLIPYIYNLWAFNSITPWSILQNGWTQLNGFGLQNVSAKKLFEQFFDLNMGLFWYLPIFMVVAMYSFLFISKRDKRNLFLFFVMLLTALFYQTNPAWHFGTAGYGPTRHIIFTIPFFIYWIVASSNSGWKLAMIGGVILSQLFILSLNSWYLPNFENTLNNSPFAKYVLNNFPEFYNPTPEIFVDRTNHTDLNYITSAIYKNDQGECKKAYVLKTDVKKVEQECGAFSELVLNQLEDEFLRKANYSRQLVTIEATLWPDSSSCEDWYVKGKDNTYECLNDFQEASEVIGIDDPKRLHQVSDYKGVWRLERGLPVAVTIPAGYIVQYHSLDGAYVTF